MPNLTPEKRKVPSPAELRSMFGANLRQLAREAKSISALCRELGINRTQFNRYLAGESFPRPDVLYRICDFFGVDARILLEPVEQISNTSDAILTHPMIEGFLKTHEAEIPEHLLPSGLYRFSRASFVDANSFVVGISQVFRTGTHTFIRGYEAKDALRQQGLPTSPKEREFRGVALMQEGGVVFLVSRRNALTFSFNFVAPQSSFQNNYWVGYTARTAPESVNSQRAARLVMEHLNRSFGEKLSAARQAGMCEEKDLLPYHRRHLQVGQPFQ